jgi:hypothetical protein
VIDSLTAVLRQMIENLPCANCRNRGTYQPGQTVELIGSQVCKPCFDELLAMRVRQMTIVRRGRKMLIERI